MIIKGKARGGAGGLAKHLERDDNNERVQLKELRGVVADTLTDALYEMAALGSAARTDRPLYHASISPEREMTDAQWQESIDALEKKLGFEGQPRAVVEHGKKGREHVHVVWMRVDLDHMKAISDSHNYRKHEEVARDLERRFGHDRVQGAHAERDGQPRPERTPGHDEMQQAERTGLTPQQAKQWITALWQATDSGKAFKAALESQGWDLARGDRRDYVLIDPHGEVHSLARRVDGVRAADVRARMKDVPVQSLPSVKQAKQQQRDRQTERTAPPRPERTATPGRDPIQAGQQDEARRQSQVEKEQGRHEAEPLKSQQAKKPEAEPTDPSRDKQQAHETPARGDHHARGTAAAEPVKEAGLFVHDVATNVTQRLAGFIGGLLGALLNPGSSAASYSTESPAERAAAYRTQRLSRDALRSIRDSIDRDEPLRAEDVRNLAPDLLENIRARGDAALLDSIRRMEEDRTRDYERGRTREL